MYGDEKPYPTADIYIEVQRQPYLLNVGVADKLSFSVVLGSDLPVLFDLLHQSQSCNVAVTRAQAKLVNEPSQYPAFLWLTPRCPAWKDPNVMQTKEARLQHMVIKLSDEIAPDLPLGFKVPSNIVQMQRDDPILITLFQSAKEREV